MSVTVFGPRRAHYSTAGPAFQCRWGRLSASAAESGFEEVEEELSRRGLAHAYRHPPNTEYRALGADTERGSASWQGHLEPLARGAVRALADRGNGIGEGWADCRMDTLQTDDSQGDSRAGSSGDLDCSDFTTQEEAQGVLDEDSSDPNGFNGEPENGVARQGLHDR
jgi:hypothetical protein